MNDLLKQLDTLLKPINDAMRNVAPAQLIRYVAIYMLISGVINLCGSVALITAGALGGAATALGSVAGTTAEGQQAVAALGTVSGLALVSGILYFIAAPALIVVALGLFRRMGWSRMGAVVVLAASAILSLIGLVGGGGILNLIWILAGLYVAYFFYTDAGIKREFGQA
ncbi:MAG: hypothetical protein GC179_01600 [Anaerolineaceae bacterium]|nr:hypothetical protein [Anaerolineaceae bacterium]